MKTLIVSFVILFSASWIFSQGAGTIRYTETIKMDFEGPDGMDLGDMLPESMSADKELHFAEKISVYRDSPDNEDEETEMSSDDGSMQIVIRRGSSEDIFYKDMANKTSIHQTDFMGKEFLIEDAVTKLKWKLTGEKIKYLGHVCQKAEMTEKADREGEDDRHVVAWFTSEIPMSIGPDHYGQLPGAILMLSIDEGKTEIKATEITFELPSDKALAKPRKGKKVNKKEFDKLVDVKMKEMNKMHGGSGTFIIRG